MSKIFCRLYILCTSHKASWCKCAKIQVPGPAYVSSQKRLNKHHIHSVRNKSRCYLHMFTLQVTMHVTSLENNAKLFL